MARHLDVEIQANPKILRAGPFTPTKGTAKSAPPKDLANPSQQDALNDLAMTLLKEGLLRASNLKSSKLSPQFLHRPQPDLFRSSQIDHQDLRKAARKHFGASPLPADAGPPDPILVDKLGLRQCLRLGLMPWRQAGGTTFIAVSRPEIFSHQRRHLEYLFGPLTMLEAKPSQIDALLQGLRGPNIAHRAATRVPTAESCRSWSIKPYLPHLLIAAIASLTLAYFAPIFASVLVLAIAVLSLSLGVALKILACIASLRQPTQVKASPPTHLPPVTIIVALYRESNIAQRLVRRLARLDYPQDLLEILLVIEADDSKTRDALAGVQLPETMRVITAPEGSIKTKPRALNIALDHARGDIIGVYDAEDAPEPDQIRKVVTRFHNAPPKVVCLQGILDYYNPTSNWISRCFTLEYAAWFRQLLPGIAKLGLMVPLGGTTLFFRRHALEKIGAWDAHNVTEDADLGIRLHRQGYRTEILETVTLEEANCRPLAWVKQRSRWIKGYMITWIVHMREPRRLHKDIGTAAFCGFQVMFLGSVLQALLAPLIWSFWLSAFGIAHPLRPYLYDWVFIMMIGVFLLTAAIDAVIFWIALRKTEHRLSRLWVLSLHGYFPLATFAAYKALWELISRPFYWDKTSHGHFDPMETVTPPIAPSEFSVLRPLPAAGFQKPGSSGFLAPHKQRLRRAL